MDEEVAEDAAARVTGYYPAHLRRSGGAGRPFDLANDTAYREWRDAKLAHYPTSVGDWLVEVTDLEHPTPAERYRLLDRLRLGNMVLYQSGTTVHRGVLLAFSDQLGLRQPNRNPAAGSDGLSAIRVNDAAHDGEYIPYTDRPLRWHTDGYYNGPGQRIRAFLLHCVRPGAAGGVNSLLDPEIAYIRLRDDDPEAVAALMHPDTMRIPDRVADGVVLRPAVTGPVFSIDRLTGALHMRYTARTTSIAWRDDGATRRALERLERILATPGDALLSHRLDSGQGILCNNVLHNRSAFRDGPGQGRLLYRARFTERIPET